MSGIFKVCNSALQHLGVMAVGIVLLATACTDSQTTTETSQPLVEGTAAIPLFELLPSSKTNITFSNNLKEDVSNRENLLSYNYFYNGGGVAVGDINNDGLPDLLFTGNEVKNRLYLNKGNLEFEDITKQAGLESKGRWSTGATMGDVNGDGHLDIYICNSGPKNQQQERENFLFLNNGDLTFSEVAAQTGVNDGNYSTQAAFLDFDRDGDLDLFVINHAVYFNMPMNRVLQALKDKENLEAVSNNLYRNDGNGQFTRVTEASGLLRFGYGLGMVVSDINMDGWPDVYVANDFSVPDFMYINNGDGTFTDQQKQYTRHVAWFGMGCDVADFNNDGLVDIGVVDMAADDHVRGKTLMASMDEEAFWSYVKGLGYQYQYMFNAFQLNNGNGSFSNIANMCGMASTDWSWTALFADLDNDGHKDYLVTNGFRRYALDNDFRNELRQTRKSLGGNVPVNKRQELYNQMPEVSLPNLLFQNKGNLTFEKVGEQWGLGQPSFSNGAAVADLDNDGDLDLVVNNIDAEAFVYNNKSRELNQHNYLRVKLVGGATHQVANAKVSLFFANNSQQYQEYAPTRGYQSSMEHVLHFGLGNEGAVQSLRVEWPDGTETTIQQPDINQKLVISRAEVEAVPAKEGAREEPLLQAVNPADYGLTFRHQENGYNDFSREILLPHRQSMLGGFAAVGDVNGDGLDDLYFGGAAQQASILYIQSKSGKLEVASAQPWTSHYASEDMDALFFDADGDADLDLYVVSGGGGEFEPGAGPLQDRLYVNDGAGNYSFAGNALPDMRSSGLCVKAADYDADGDLDLFVGGRNIPGRYPFAPRSYLLQNQGGTFTDVTSKQALDLLKPGLVTDAVWVDFSGDGRIDLVLVGEWMEPLFLSNEVSGFVKQNEKLGITSMSGWWYQIEAADLDQDGDLDFLLGNIGLNNKFHPSAEKPLRLFCNDFDGNKTLDIVLGKEYHGKMVPVRGRECSSEQMPFIKDKFPTYRGFAEASLGDILGEEKLEGSLYLEAQQFASGVLWNEGGSYVWKPLPRLAQIAPLNGAVVGDYNHDSKPDILLAGNMLQTEVETPRYDAGSGLVLLGQGNQAFQPLSIVESGFYAPGDAKEITPIQLAGKQAFLVTNNNGPVQLFVQPQPEKP